MINFPKFSRRGKSKVQYDSINGHLYSQWKDIKIVSFVSTLPLVGNETSPVNMVAKWFNSLVQRHYRHIIVSYVVWI